MIARPTCTGACSMHYWSLLYNAHLECKVHLTKHESATRFSKLLCTLPPRLPWISLNTAYCPHIAACLQHNNAYNTRRHGDLRCRNQRDGSTLYLQWLNTASTMSALSYAANEPSMHTCPNYFIHDTHYSFFSSYSSIPKSTLYYSSFSLLIILSLLWVVSQATQIFYVYKCVGNWINKHSPLWQP